MEAPNRVNHPSRVEKHRAKRAIKRRLKPDVRGLAGSRDRVPCGFLGQSPKRSLRQSLNRRKPTKAVQKSNRRKIN